MLGARAVFCAGHKLAQHASIHGHSYEVWGYTNESCDVEELQRDLAQVCLLLDHKMLNDVLPGLPTMENIAVFVALHLPRLDKVIIARPLEGLSCEYQCSTSAA